MHIAILSDPNNFHTRKWAKALERQGADVTVFSFDKNEQSEIKAVQVKPAMAPGGKYSFLSYMTSGKRLNQALGEAKVDLVNALNITPFGVWARYGGVRPLIASALGADILEFPTNPEARKKILERSWANTEGGSGFRKIKAGLLNAQYRSQVKATLEYADLVTGDNRELVDKIKNWFGVKEEKVKLLRWGVEPDFFEAKGEEVERMRIRLKMQIGDRVILSPRGAKAIYQADIILDSFRNLLSENHPNLHFVMLSAGYEVSTSIRKEALSLSEKHSNFHFIEHTLSIFEMRALWSLTEVFVSGPIYDGYSAAVAEGRYAGAIPILNNIPANREVIGHEQTGLILDKFNSIHISTAIKKVLTKDEGWKSHLRAENRKWIEEWSMIDTNALSFMSWCLDIRKGYI